MLQSMPNSLFSKPSSFVILLVRNSCESSNSLLVICFISMPRNLFILPSFVSMNPSEPFFIDSTKILMSTIKLLTIMQSSTYVMMSIPFLKERQGSIWDWMNPRTNEPDLSFLYQLKLACFNPYSDLFSFKIYFREDSSSVAPSEILMEDTSIYQHLDQPVEMPGQNRLLSNQGCIFELSIRLSVL